MLPIILHSSFAGSYRLALLLGLTAALVVHSTLGATRIWTGGHASSANWNLRDNWGGAAVPAHGDTLVFPSGAARLFNTNNLVGLRLDSILFNGLAGGYRLRGNGVIVTNGISAVADAVNTVDLASLTLAAEQTFNVSANGLLTINSDIALGGFNLIFQTFGDMTVAGAISGRGNLIKAGSGLLTFSGPSANTYEGSLAINGGTLAMNKRETISIVPLNIVGRIAVPGDLFVGNFAGSVIAKLNFEHQIANTSTVVIANESTLDLNGKDDTIASLVLTGGTVTTGEGVLTLNSNVTVNGHATGSVISGRLFLPLTRTFNVGDGSAAIDLDVSASITGGFVIGTPISYAGVTKTGTGTLRLSGTNTYSGVTRVDTGLLRVAQDSALGTSTGNTIVASGAEILIETAVNTLREPLNIAGAGIGGASGAIRLGSGATIATNIVLSAPATIHTLAGGNLTIEGVISGTGPLTKIGPGTLVLAGDSANTFTGELIAGDGLLFLSKLFGSAVQGDLVIGANGTGAIARQTRSANLGGAVTVNLASLYDLNGFNESIDALTLSDGGDVQTGTGQLTVQGDVEVKSSLLLSSSKIDGRLHVDSGERRIIVPDNGPPLADSTELVINARIAGSANIIKSGGGDLTLAASNSFTGTLTVEGGRLGVTDGHALGSSAAQTILTGDSSLGLYGVFGGSTGIIVNEPLFLNTTGLGGIRALLSYGSNTWTGTIFLAQPSVVNVLTNSTLNVTGAINGLSGLTKIGGGLLLYSGTASNTYIGTTRVNEGTLRLARGGVNRSIPGTLIVGDGAGGIQADAVEVHSPSQINDLTAVTVSTSGALRLLADDNIGSLAGSGRVGLLGGGTELTTGRNDSSTTYEGNISGSGSLRKSGAGAFTLTGTNTYTGDTLVDDGMLVVDGEQPDSDIYVGPTGTLSGVGTVGNLSIGGTLRPGNPRGRLDIASVNFLPNSTFAVELQHTPDEVGFYPSHNWFRSSGAVDVTGANLSVSLGFAPVAGQTFILGNKTQPGAVTGTFNGRPEGAVIIRNDVPLHLTYAGDTGNDIVLAVGNLPLQVASTRIEAGNGNGRIDPNECNDLFVTIENVGALSINGVTTRLESLDPRIAVTQAESAYGDVPGLAARTNRTAFQIRIASGYPCNSAVDLHLVIQSANHGSFALPVRLLAGSLGESQTVESTDVPRLVPDLGITQSTIDWPDNFQVGQVRVKIHATHPATGNLRFRLRNDWGEVLLTANRGGTGNNYGINCESPTVFDDDAAVNIAGASAPFAGTFAPENSLSPFVNRLSGGIWTLTVEDTVAGNVGALQCWSLELTRAVCTDGGGGCESCTTRLTGSFSESTPTMPKRLTGTVVASGCGNVNHCPGTTSEPGPFRYNTHSFTNDGPDTCVTVLATVPCSAWTNALYFSAHLGDLNPGDLCGNYLGDVGQGIHSYYGEGSAFSFPVPSGERFTVVVAERSHLEGCDRYGLELFGLPCAQEQPRLHIANDAGPDNVRLHWSTAYPGFQLQGTPAFSGVAPFGFTNMANPIVVLDGHYSVTNRHDNTNNGFFRLRKP